MHSTLKVQMQTRNMNMLLTRRANTNKRPARAFFFAFCGFVAFKKNKINVATVVNTATIPDAPKHSGQLAVFAAPGWDYRGA
jgi:hypothetical protein